MRRRFVVLIGILVSLMFVISTASAETSISDIGITADNLYLRGNASLFNLTADGDISVGEDISALGDLYFSGDTNQSLRFSVDEDTNFAEIQKLIEGIWQPSSFEVGTNSLWVGPRIGVASAGHHLVTEDSDGTWHFHTHSDFNGEVTFSDAHIINAYQYTEREIVVPYDSGEWTGLVYDYYYPSADHRMIQRAYYKTGTTGATEPVRLQVWEGLNDSGIVVFDRKYPPSNFPSDTEIIVDATGFVEFDEGMNYLVRLSSDANFSLRGTPDMSYPWTAGDVTLVRLDNLLQTKGWTNGTNFTDGQLLITNRQIYAANETGIQTGTWESNSGKWNILGSGESFSNTNITANYFIGDGSQLTGIFGGLWTNVSGVATYDGDVNISDGSISIQKSDDKPYIDFIDSNGDSDGRIYGYSNSIQIRSPNGASTYFSVDTGAGTTEMFDDAYVSYDFYVGEDLYVNDDTLFVDASADKVGIGTDEPSYELEVIGDVSAEYFIGDGSQLTGMLWQNISGIATYDGSISVDGNLISQQSDGIYIGGIKLEENQWEVNNTGADWTKKLGTGYWQDIAVSSTGRHQTTVAYHDPIMISSDHGDTWTSASGTDGPEWYGVAMSSDGEYQTAMALYDDIYISSDYGVTWTGASAGGGSWSNVDMSSDGQMQVAAKGGIGAAGYIYISYDYGNTWTPKSDVEGYWQSVAMSSDGRYISAVEAGNKTYRSDDYGETWARIGGSGSLLLWDDIAMSSDGRYQTAVNEDSDEKIFVSSDYGLSFSWKGLTRSGYAVGMSSDGRIQVVGVSNFDPSDDSLYLSEDYGQTWTQIPSSSEATWMGIDMSSDGMYITAVADNDGVFVSQSDYQFVGDVKIDGDLNVTGTSYSEGLSVYHDANENYNILEFQIYKDPLMFGNFDWNESGGKVGLDQGLIIDGGPNQRDFTVANGNIYIRRADEIPQIDFLDSTGTYVNARLRAGSQPYIFQITNGSSSPIFEVNTNLSTVNVSGNITADYFIGDGSQLTGIDTGISLWTNSSGDTTLTSGNVGIGTDEPSSKLEVVGSVNISGNITAEKIYFEGSGADYISWNSVDDWFISSSLIEAPGIFVSGDLIGDNLVVSTADISDYLETPIIRNANGDTFTIEDDLDVAGNVSADYYYGDGSQLSGLSDTDTHVAGSGYLYNDSTYMYLNGSLLNATIDARENNTVIWSENGSDIYYNGGDVGIGATAPAYPLDIVGATNYVQLRLASNTDDSTTKTAGFSARHYLTTEEDVAGLVMESSSTENRMFWGGGSSGFNDATKHIFYTAPDTTTTSGTQRVTIDESGLDVNGNLTVDDYAIIGDDLVVSGNVGIGTSTPTSILHIEKDLGGVLVSRLNNSASDGISQQIVGASDDSQINLIANSGPGSHLSVPVGGAGIAVDQGGVMVLAVGDGGSATETARLTSTSMNVGNGDLFVDISTERVGIGTTNPTQELEVDGSVNISGSVYVPEISNDAGDLKIQPDAQGDVVLFGDGQVANDENSRTLYLRREAPEGGGYIRTYISATNKGYIHSNIPMNFQAQQQFTINSVTNSIYFKVGDNDSVEKFYFRDSDNNDVVTIDSNGVMTLDKNNGAYLNLVRGTQNKISNFFDSTYTDLRFEGDKNYNRIGTWIDKDFQIVTNSLPRVTIDNDGLVGIGTTNPTSKLEVVGDANITGDIIVGSNYVIEGGDSKSIMRKIQLKVRDGATPGTNIDTEQITSQGRAYNAPAITDADDLAKSGSSGSYSLSFNGENLILDISETVTHVLSVGVIGDDLNDGGGGGYYVHTLVVDGNIQLMIEQSGSETNLDWTVLTNTGSDHILFDVQFITSD